MSRRRSRRRTARPGPALLIAGAAGALAAAGFAFRGRLAALPAKLRRRDDRPGNADWTCQCGQDYRVTGQGRHRVYWPAGADKAEPVLSGKCVNCERPLPTT
jgi:hypothetical protein